MGPKQKGIVSQSVKEILGLYHCRDLFKISLTHTTRIRFSRFRQSRALGKDRDFELLLEFSIAGSQNSETANWGFKYGVGCPYYEEGAVRGGDS